MRRPFKQPLQNPRPLGCSMGPEKRIPLRRAWRPQKARKTLCNISIAFCKANVLKIYFNLGFLTRAFRSICSMREQQNPFGDWCLQNKQWFELTSFRSPHAPKTNLARIARETCVCNNDVFEQEHAVSIPSNFVSWMGVYT